MISVRNITKSFGGKNVLDELNLEIPKGETVVVMGQSGVREKRLAQNYYWTDCR